MQREVAPRVFPRGRLAASLVLGALAVSSLSKAQEGSPAVDFARDVQPLLQGQCVMCHNAVVGLGGLRLDSREMALRGGVSGPAFVPGKGHGSLLVKRLLGTGGGVRMPPNFEPWSSERIALVKRWIDEGAAWPAPRDPTANRSAVAAGTVSRRPPPDFVRDIAPIFKESCVRCHGPTRERSGLRLDARALVLKGGLSGQVIVPGKGQDSPLVQRLRGQVSPRMPFERAPLPPERIALIEAWIDAGALGPDDGPTETKSAAHWAYVKPVRAALPSVRNEAWVKNPIDTFVLARLEKEALGPSPEAPPEILIRRLSLDLVGLPPTLEEIDSFLADRRPGAYERVVDRLLGSPRYGERWARPWLDLARYADSHGYEKDQLRVAWAYRDWVIDALNRDLSFRDFTVEQLAGDMLDNASFEQKVATGFHRNTLLNQEGGIDVEEARFETLVDRVNTTGAVFLGSTIGCAQCHNHKFDPFSQRDYYRLMAFYDNVEYTVHGQGEEMVGDRWIVEPELELPTPEQAKRRAALRQEADALVFEVENRELEAELPAFERQITGPLPAWTPLPIVRVHATSGARFEKQPDESVLVSGENSEGSGVGTDAAKKRPEKDTYTVTVRTALSGITAFRLEALPDPSLPQRGPGRSLSGAYVLTDFRVRSGEKEKALLRAGADINQKRWEAARAIDGDVATGWGVTTDPELGKPHFLVVQAKQPVGTRAKVGTSATTQTLIFTLDFQSGWPEQSSLGRFRFSATTSANPWGGLPVPDAVRTILDTPRGERTREQKGSLLTWFRPLAPSLDAARYRLGQIRRELDEMKVKTTLVMKERVGYERPSTFFRNRGSFMSPGERVYAAVPAVLGSLPDDQAPNRLGLARWLVSDGNPLTARVTVNRLWETMFGRGLVLTSEDFGSQGERPSHPELLDWLAVEFMENGWSQKKILRQIVTSATYRQSSRATAGQLERDPDNRLLARGPRFRVEAEMVRDLALSASGLLSDKVGGPSVFPVQPDGVWNNPYSKVKWETSADEDRYRRSLYTFIRRTSPYPSLVTFDAPSREFCTVRRVRTNTPLQALTTLNDPVFVEAARKLAGRMMAEAGTEPRERISLGYRLCTARRPPEADLDSLLVFFEKEAERFAREPEGAKALLEGDATLPEPAVRAALTMVGNVLLSTDAVLTKE
jgi:mono/diheme cytochrome c family protein